MNVNFFTSDKKGIRILRHVVFWVVYYVTYKALSTIYPVQESGFISTFHEDLVFLPIDIGATYFTIYFLIPRFLLKRKYVEFSLLLVGSVVVFLILTQVIYFYIYLPSFHGEYFAMLKENGHSFWQANYFYLLVSYYSVVMVAAAIKLTKYWLQEQQSLAQLKTQNLQSEIALLRSQVNPHFLFNVLNNIDSLIFKDQQEASNMLIKLSEIMRYMLYEANTEKVSLQKEINYLKSYIDLQKVRFKDPGFVEINIAGDTSGKSIIPMLFVPFIENAFKHGEKAVKSPGIVIHLSAEHNKVTLKVVNHFSTHEVFQKDKAGGIGLSNVRRRLELLYPGKHRLVINKENSKYIVLLNIEL